MKSEIRKARENYKRKLELNFKTGDIRTVWFGKVSQNDKNNLQHTVNISSKVTGLKQSTLTGRYEKQVLHKATKISNLLLFFICGKDDHNYNYIIDMFIFYHD